MMEMKQKDRVMRNAMVLFARGGFRAPDLSLVAAFSGVRPEVLREHFSTEEELMLTTYEHCRRAIRKYIERGAEPGAPFREILRHLWMHALDWSDEYPLEHDYLQAYARLRDLQAEPGEEGSPSEDGPGLFQWALQRALARGEVASLNPRFIILSLSSWFAAVVPYLRKLKGDEREDFKETSFDLAWRAIAPQADGDYGRVLRGLRGLTTDRGDIIG